MGLLEYAPESIRMSVSMAVMVPSRVAPILTRVSAEETGPVARNTSSRLMTIFTGRPDLRASTAATGST